jgi:hypothetical protein
MDGYGRIYKDIFRDLEYEWISYPILRYPNISLYILEHIQAIYPNSYPLHLSPHILIYPK